MLKPLAGVLLLLALATSARAAAVNIVAELDPGQSGPIYGWSLRVSTQNVIVDEVVLLVTGFDTFDFNFGDPRISPSASGFFRDPLGDGPSTLVISTAPGLDLVDRGSTNAFLGTLLGPSNAVGSVVIEGCDAACGGTIFDTIGYAVSDYSLHVIPEPAIVPIGTGLALAGLAALRTARRRAA